MVLGSGHASMLTASGQELYRVLAQRTSERRRETSEENQDVRLSRARDLRERLDEYCPAQLTYSQRGATGGGPLPAGYGYHHHRQCIGRGRAAFERAASALLTWRMHEGAGLTVAADGPARGGGTVVLCLGRPVGLVIPCRVVYVIEEERRRGFAYGTLPGHPEQGEEAFIVELADDGSVWAEISAFSRPGDLVTRLSGPVGRMIQAQFTRRYAKALARATASST
jgi:uncharacterized protein (UPF0548 family)